MNKRTIYIIIISLCFYSSCNDFLEIEPGAQISITEQLSTKTGVELAVRGVYATIENLLSSLDGAIYADVQGGNITFTPNNNDVVTVPGPIERSYAFSDTEMASEYRIWYESWYGLINQVNVILSYRDRYTFLSQRELDQLTAELLTIRAMAHYQLVLYYAQNYNFTPSASHLGVVYNTNTLDPGVDFPSRLTMAQTYEQLKEDLDNALSLFTDKPVLRERLDYEYFNTLTAQALYARIALQMNDWERARRLSAQVINTAGVSLMTTEEYVSQWELENDPVSEVILEFPASRSLEGNATFTLAFHYRDTSNNVEFADHVASGDLLALYSTDDVRSGMFIPIDLPTQVNGVLQNVTYYFTKKFQDNPGTTHIRLSEMYLVRAEANARLNEKDRALQDLDLLRVRANLPALADATTVLEEIFLERRRELAFERHLLFDIMRFKRNIRRNDGCTGNVCTLDYPSDFMILPIPFSSTGLNENMVQNDGY